MAIISPTILTGDLNIFNQKAKDLTAFASRIQIDICDGIFAPNKTIDPKYINLPDANVAFDFHLIAAHPSQYLDDIIAKKPHLIILHAEATEDLAPLLTKIKSANIKTGIAFLQSTFPGKYTDLINTADHALIFAGNLGEMGGAADLLQLEKVRVIRDIKPTIEIGWDGGANIYNVRTIAHHRVNIINVGSAISNADSPKEAYQILNEEANKEELD